MGRPKKVETTLQSLDDCTRAMTDLLVAQATVEKLAAGQALAVAGAQARYEQDLDAARKRAAELEAELKAYYYAHIGELEVGDRQHVKLSTGVMGRRFTPGKLAPLNRSWTWAAIFVKVRELWPRKFMRQAEPELDKDKLKDELSAEDLAKAGLRVKHDEVFYAEPDRPTVPSEVRP